MASKKPTADAAIAGLPKLELRQVDELIPYERNARTHDDDQIAELVASIREYGWTNPILADERIRAGHGRALAAKALYKRGETIRLPNGETIPFGTVPVIDCSGWTEEQKRLYVLTDNKVALNAGWDDTLLRLELGELVAADADIELTGFSPKEIKKLLATPPEASSESQLGDLRYQVIVVAKDEDHQRELLERFESEGLECKALIS